MWVAQNTMIYLKPTDYVLLDMTCFLTQLYEPVTKRRERAESIDGEEEMETE